MYVYTRLSLVQAVQMSDSEHWHVCHRGVVINNLSVVSAASGKVHLNHDFA